MEMNFELGNLRSSIHDKISLPSKTYYIEEPHDFVL